MIKKLLILLFVLLSFSSMADEKRRLNLVFISGDGDFVWHDYQSRNFKKHVSNKEIRKEIIKNARACSTCITHIFDSRKVRELKNLMLVNTNIRHTVIADGKIIYKKSFYENQGLFSLANDEFMDWSLESRSEINLAYFGHTIPNEEQHNFLFLLSTVVTRSDRAINYVLLSSCHEANSDIFEDILEYSKYVVASRTKIPLKFLKADELFEASEGNRGDEYFKKKLKDNFKHISEEYFPAVQLGLHKEGKLLMEIKKEDKIEEAQ